MTLHDHFPLPLFAQADPGAAPQEGGSDMSFIDFILAGGTVGGIIILLSFAAVAMVIYNFWKVRESELAPRDLVDELHKMLAEGRVDEALEFCDDPDRRCFLTEVIAAGLTRYRRSAFGSLELKGALEEAGQEQVARLYRATDGMALIASIAPMLGLLGTVVGINGAFATISRAEGFARPDQLAGDISLALVTTIMGLSVAIPVTAAVTFFRNRIDSLAGDVSAMVEDLAAHLEDGHSPPAPAAPRSRPAAPLAPSAR